MKTSTKAHTTEALMICPETTSEPTVLQRRQLCNRRIAIVLEECRPSIRHDRGGLCRFAERGGGAHGML